MTTGRRDRDVLPIVLVVIGGAAAVAFALVLRDGTAVGHDSAGYLSVADSLRSGRGLSTPLGLPLHGMSPAEFAEAGDRLPVSGYPVLYSVLLALGGSLGVEGRDAAAVINALGGIGMVVLAALATWHTARRRVAPVVLVAGFLLVQPLLLVQLARFVQPDALFGALMLGQVLLTWTYLRTPAGRSLAVLIVFTAGLLLLRQLGLALVGSGSLAIVLLGVGPMARRVRDAAVYAGLSLTPLAIFWYATSRNSAGESSVARIATHLPTADDYGLTIDTVEDWLAGLLAPDPWITIAWILTLLLVAGSVVGWRASVRRTRSVATTTEGRDRDGRLLAAVLGLTLVAYLAVLWITAAFLDDDVPVSGRYLQPLLALVLPILAGGLVHLTEAVPKDRRQLLSIVLLAVTGALLAGRAAVALEHGAGLPIVDRSSAVGPYLESLPDDALVFAVAPEWIYNAVGRPAYVLPFAVNRYTGEPSAEVDRDLAELVALADEYDVYVVYPPAGFREYIVPYDQLARQVPLVEVHRGGTETVYQIVVAS